MYTVDHLGIDPEYKVSVDSMLTFFRAKDNFAVISKKQEKKKP